MFARTVASFHSTEVPLTKFLKRSWSLIRKSKEIITLSKLTTITFDAAKPGKKKKKKKDFYKNAWRDSFKKPLTKVSKAALTGIILYLPHVQWNICLKMMSWDRQVGIEFYRICSKSCYFRENDEIIWPKTS